MKEKLVSLLELALQSLTTEGIFPERPGVQIRIENTRSRDHGDFACNLAMMLAKQAGMSPRDLAGKILQALPSADFLEKAEIAGPGFINFFLARGTQQAVIGKILQEKERFGHSNIGQGEKLTLEFVSANPTGPLHVGHGRGAAYGASLAGILRASGYEVQTEYYVNDAGRQMHILATSVWLRYLQFSDDKVRFPDNGYRGDYINDIAHKVASEIGDTAKHPWQEIAVGIPADESEGGDKEKHIDALVTRAKELLGEEGYQLFFKAALESILADIRQDLEAFNVVYDNWFSEQSLMDSGDIEDGIARLEKAGHLYQQDGARWFVSSRFGDDKDRVVVRDNGQTTYFASDIAYFLNKMKRGFDRALYIFGADHHGYVPRLKSVAMGLGEDPEKLEVQLVQFAVLYRGGEKVQMSTRSGQFVTLRELREEVGADAARFFYVMRSHEQHLDFDLDLAKSRSNDNPVYYVQYAHARVCSIIRQFTERNIVMDETAGLDHLEKLLETQEQDLLTALARYPEVLAQAARHRAPHTMAHYLRELAQQLHSWYNACPVIALEDDDLRQARLLLARATGQVLANGLTLIGVSAPEQM